MKRWVAIAIVVGSISVFAGVAFAQMGWGPGYGMGWGYGPHGMMGWGPGAGMGPGQGWGPGPGAGGQYPCPGAAGANATANQVTEESAKQIAQQYAEKYLKGYTVDKVLPFTTTAGWTAYSVELKGPKDEVRVLHVNPWGGVMPFGGPRYRAG